MICIDDFAWTKHSLASDRYVQFSVIKHKCTCRLWRMGYSRRGPNAMYTLFVDVSPNGNGGTRKWMVEGDFAVTCLLAELMK